MQEQPDVDGKRRIAFLSRGAELLTMKTAGVFNNIRHSTPEKKC
jgi:hypothetical protein